MRRRPSARRDRRRLERVTYFFPTLSTARRQTSRIGRAGRRAVGRPRAHPFSTVAGFGSRAPPSTAQKQTTK